MKIKPAKKNSHKKISREKHFLSKNFTCVKKLRYIFCFLEKILETKYSRLKKYFFSKKKFKKNLTTKK